MAFINDHYLKLQAGYLFPEIARRVAEFKRANSAIAGRIISCGIGDVTEPLPDACIQAMHKAVDDMARRETFHGYGPGTGHTWLREAIATHDFRDRGLDITADEVFVSDGSKCDCGAILDILSSGPSGGGGNRIAITDPVYPVYVDTNVMAGNTGPARDGRYEGLVHLPCTAANDFIAPLPQAPVDIIYLCYPNNPTGAMITRERLAEWVDYALAHDAIILYDVAYKEYVADPALPRSIYEIPGARRCAFEFHSFSKNGGFTGVRCGYTVCPRDLTGVARSSGQRVPLHGLWTRRWNTKSNGVSYIVQRGAEALYTDDGRRQVQALIDHYMTNARILKEGCEAVGLTVHGGVHAPYLWVECPRGVDSWTMFDHLLREANIVTTPGTGFGRSGEGYFRISAFNTRANIEESVLRLGAMKLTATENQHGGHRGHRGGGRSDAG
jgi:LL-diaminopimelate aminotransferase